MIPFIWRKKIKKCCATCKHYAPTKVGGNRLASVELGLCNNEDTRKNVMSYGRSEQGFYKYDGVLSELGGVSFSPEFLCNNYKSKTK